MHMAVPATPAQVKAQIARARSARSGPLAIVDIGSNSVRLVIYESFSRTPSILHNEQAICAIGRNMVSSGQLSEQRIASALAALARYRTGTDAHRADKPEAVATA